MTNNHKHEWVIAYHNIRYRDEEGVEYIIDFYKCACGAGGKVVTPKPMFDKGLKKLGIEKL